MRLRITSASTIHVFASWAGSETLFKLDAWILGSALEAA